MKQLSPLSVLTLLLLGGLAIAGWAYGTHWKQVALGNKFTPAEKLLVSLQDQIEILSEENGDLAEALNELRKKQETK